MTWDGARPGLIAARAFIGGDGEKTPTAAKPPEWAAAAAAAKEEEEEEDARRGAWGEGASSDPDDPFHRDWPFWHADAGGPPDAERFGSVSPGLCVPDPDSPPWSPTP